MLGSTTLWASNIRDPAKFSFPSWELGGILCFVILLAVALRMLERRWCDEPDLKFCNRRVRVRGSSACDDEAFELKEMLMTGGRQKEMID